jgi:hypothetical protein
MNVDCESCEVNSSDDPSAMADCFVSGAPAERVAPDRLELELEETTIFAVEPQL